MDLLSNLLIDTFSIMLLVVLYMQLLKQTEQNLLPDKLYKLILQITMLMLVVDIFSRFDGNPGTAYPIINSCGNFLIFMLNPVLPSLWLLYAHYQVYHDEGKTKRLRYPLIAVNAVNIVVLVLSQFFNWYYYIDSGNIYHRGPLFWLPASITVALMLASFILIAVNRRKIEKKYFFSLLFFAVPPFICIFLAILFYGISLMLNSVVISLLIVFFDIQNNSMYIDYVTGVNNRQKLEAYMKKRINASTAHKTFSAILLDMNDFKAINDTYGHDMGDDALETSALLLKSCLRADDFIARFGGDEFCIILNVSNKTDLEATVGRINRCLEKYNEAGAKPYKIDFSMGYAVYDPGSHMKLEEFRKHIDQLMYEDKRSKRPV